MEALQGLRTCPRSAHVWGSFTGQRPLAPGTCRRAGGELARLEPPLLAPVPFSSHPVPPAQATGSPDTSRRPGRARRRGLSPARTWRERPRAGGLQRGSRLPRGRLRAAHLRFSPPTRGATREGLAQPSPRSRETAPRRGGAGPEGSAPPRK